MSIVLLDFILHIDTHLRALIEQYGLLTYVILFLIVFCETGLVVTPFLPGDSLLFAAGALAAQDALHIGVLFSLFFVAAILGDAANYALGKHIGRRAFRPDARFLNHEHLVRTQEFYERHGGKAIIIARFLPIVRTFAPFVAGIGQMQYTRFTAFNIAGALLWTTVFCLGGYLFGNVPIVQENFTIAIAVIIVLSFVPGIVEWVRHSRRRKT